MLKEKYFIYGKHAVIAAINNKDRNIEAIYIDKFNYELQKKIKILLNKNNLEKKIELVNNNLIKGYLKKNVKHQGIIVEAEKLNLSDFSEIFNNKNKSLYQYGVILDSLTDVNNVGAIYRSAKAFGIDFIINTKRHTVLETNSLLNTACGAFDALKTYTTNNLVNAIQKLKKNNWWIIGLDHSEKKHFNDVLERMDQIDKCIFVFGSEGKGIRRLVKQNCNFIANIPNLPDTNSINVSNSAAIIFYFLFEKKFNKKR